MKAVVAAFNQEKALVGAFSVITNLRMELFEPVVNTRELLSNAAKEECCQLLMSDTISEVSGNFHIGFNGHR